MRRGGTRRLGLAVGLLSGLAWYLVFGFEVIFHHQDPHIDWGEVSVAALLSFVVGWGRCASDCLADVGTLKLEHYRGGVAAIPASLPAR